MKITDKGLYVDTIVASSCKPNLTGTSKFVTESGANLFIKGEDLVIMYEMLRFRFEGVSDGDSFKEHWSKHFERKYQKSKDDE